MYDVYRAFRVRLCMIAGLVVFLILGVSFSRGAYADQLSQACTQLSAICAACPGLAVACEVCDQLAQGCRPPYPACSNPPVGYDSCGNIDGKYCVCEYVAEGGAACGHYDDGDSCGGNRTCSNGSDDCPAGYFCAENPSCGRLCTRYIACTSE